MSSSDEDMEVHVPAAATVLGSGAQAAAASAARSALAAVAAAADDAGDDRLEAAIRARKVAAGDSVEGKERLRTRALSPERQDPFARNAAGRSYASVLQEAALERELAQVQARVAEIERSAIAAGTAAVPQAAGSAAPAAGSGRKRTRTSRWGPSADAGEAGATAEATGTEEVAETAEPKRAKSSRWGSMATVAETRVAGGGAPAAGAQAGAPSVWSDAELDAILPKSGYDVLAPPPGYVAAHPGASGPAEATAGTDAYRMPVAGAVSAEAYGVSGMAAEGADVPSLKADDYTFFAPILGKKGEADESTMGADEVRDRTILRLLLRIKNGMPAQRKGALRMLTDRADEFGAGALFAQILPLFLAPSLEDVERHLLVKVVDRVLYKVKHGVRPFVHKILVVIEPLLVDEDPYARVEGREVISNLAKAAGMACMVSNMRPDIDHADPFVRDVTAKAFAVVAVALGVDVLLPFIGAVCESSVWEARHTGVKIVQQIAILKGVGILPNLADLVAIVGPSVEDSQPVVRTVAAMAVAALAEASAPYGIDAFEPVLAPLWKGITTWSGRTLAAFLKAVGHIVPLMEPDHANHYTRQLMVVLVRHFTTTLEDMKQVVLKVVEQTISADGVPADYVRAEVLPQFFASFWVRRNAADRRGARQLVATTVALAEKVGAPVVLGHLAPLLKDEMEAFRVMGVDAVSRIVKACGVDDVDVRLEERLMDGLVLAFQDQGVGDDRIFLTGLGEFIVALGVRVRPYLEPIFSALQWRLNNADPTVRQRAADLIAMIASVVVEAGEEARLARMGVILFENLGEEYPEVLGSILAALDAIVSVIGMTKMTPPVRDLLPRLTPILRNQHEKVQEHCIYLVGRIADRGARFVSGREWMRICFDLLDLLKAGRKSTRKAAVSTFGFIAKAIGPQDVLATLLAQLKVSDRQIRVCSTVAIAIVAETCSPFTVLPALMNEYRVPEINVQNGVLKALAFMFEYIGEMAKDYIYAVAPLVADALTDRDLVKRQTAATIVRALAVGVYGLSCEDVVLHLFNHVWPNILETSPHVINAVVDAIFACRLALGGPTIMLYTLHGLFHPAKRVRAVYWRVFNEAYLANPDALVPAYPDLRALYPTTPATPPHPPVESELDYFL